MSILFCSVLFQACKKNDTPPATPVVPVAKPPVITDFNPKKGQVGATIVITGTNFDSTTASNNAVKFNGVAAIVTKATSTQLTVTVPSGATSGKIMATVNSLSDTSVSAFDVRGPLKLSVSAGITNQLIYLTGGNGFGTTPDSNDLVIYSGGIGHTCFVLGYNEDSLVLLVPYAVPGLYTDSARVDGVMVSMGNFTVDTPALTTMGIVSNITPSTAAKGTAATIILGNGSLVTGSTTVALIALYQQTGTPVSLNCSVTSLTAGLYGSTVVGFVIPNGVVANTTYAIMVTVNGATAYGPLNQWFTAQ